MPIDFELSKEQLGLRMQAREFGDQILRPLIDKVESEPIPEKRFQLTKEAYKAAYADGSAFGFLPKEYGGAGLSTPTTRSLLTSCARLIQAFPQLWSPMGWV